MKLIFLVATLLLSACSYNQAPAPLGRAGESPAEVYQQGSVSVETYAIEDTNQAIQPLEYDQQAVTPQAPQNPAVLALLDSAHQQSSQGQYATAVSKLERAVRIAPRDAKVWHELAALRYEQRKFELAISLAKKSNLLSAGNAALQRTNWFLIANCYDALGMPELAQKARANAA